MTPITVACVLVKGNVRYTPEYVARLFGMVSRWMSEPFRFVCLTDQPQSMPAKVAAITIPSPGSLFGWWSKVRLHDPAIGLTGRVLALDLDTLIVAPLAPICRYPAPFALAPHAGSFDGKDGLAVVKRFNSSVMAWDAGVTARLWTDWRPSVAGRLHGDQDWIGEQMPEAATFPLEWVPRLSEITMDGEFRVPNSAIIVLSKKPKNEEAAKRWPAFREAWA